MNPNLSPFSESRVELALGQEILFRENKKKYVLLKVDDQIKNGDVIEVSALLKKRKKELGL
jgi:biopolymer transport protein ExbD